MRLQAKLFILLYLLPSIPAAAEERFNNWYQIEIIVFKQKTVQNSDETWPYSDLQYPANMVNVSPSDPQNLSPQSLGQLKDILAYEDLVFTEEGDLSESQTASPADNFMFKSRSRRAPVKAIETIDEPIGDNAGESYNEGYNESPESSKVGLQTVNEKSDLGLSEGIVDLDALFNQNLPQAFEALKKNKHQLSGISRSINRSSLYDLLLHQAWLQPVTSESTSKPVLLQLGSHYDDNFEVDGTIKLSRSRFLHIDTDLWFTEFTPRYQQASIPLTLDLPPAAAKKYRNVVDWESNRGNYLPIHSHRLVHSRRMRRSTLHYIDHPRFGILVQVEKFEYVPEQ